MFAPRGTRPQPRAGLPPDTGGLPPSTGQGAGAGMRAGLRERAGRRVEQGRGTPSELRFRSSEGAVGRITGQQWAETHCRATLRQGGRAGALTMGLQT